MSALIPLLRPTGILKKIGFKPPLAPYNEDWCSLTAFIILYVIGVHKDGYVKNKSIDTLLSLYEK